MDADQIKICKHLARAYRHVLKAQKIILKNDWDDLNIFEITEPLSTALATWVDDTSNEALEIKEEN